MKTALIHELLEAGQALRLYAAFAESRGLSRDELATIRGNLAKTAEKAAGINVEGASVRMWLHLASHRLSVAKPADLPATLRDVADGITLIAVISKGERGEDVPAAEIIPLRPPQPRRTATTGRGGVA